MIVHSFGHQGRVSRPFTQDVPVGCAEVILRAVVPLKDVPGEIPLDEYVRPSSSGEKNRKPDYEQHLADGRSASFDLRGLVVAGFTLTGARQTKTTKNGDMRAVHFRLVRGGAPVAMGDSTIGFFIKLSCARWAHAKIYANPPLHNEAGEVVAVENVTVNAIETLGDEERATRTFRFVVRDVGSSVAPAKPVVPARSATKISPSPE